MTRITTSKDLRFRHPKVGCNCVPARGQTLLEAWEHDEFCVERLSKDEREAYDELAREDKRTN